MSLNFGQALEALKRARRSPAVAGTGRACGSCCRRPTRRATGIPEGTVCKFLPYIMMKTATGDLVPWLASQTDLLAEDWVELDS